MKPEFMRLRRALAATVTALLIAGGIVVLSPALSASAHHNTISVNASCANHVWMISWTVTNSENDKSESITSSSDTSLVPLGTTIAESASYTQSETVAGPTTKTLSLSAKWSNGVKSNDSKTIYPRDFAGICEQPPGSPVIDLTVQPCVAGDSLGAVTVGLSKLAIGSSYTIRLLASDNSVLETRLLTAQATATPLSFPGHGPGTYYATIANQADTVLATSSSQAIDPCAAAPTIMMRLEPCAPTLPLTDVAKQGSASMAPASMIPASMAPASTAPTVAEREITVQNDGLPPSTVYTVQLITTDPTAVDPVIASVPTPGDGSPTFTHTFTNVPTPGDYAVKLLGGDTPLVSDPIAAPLCFTVPTLAAPSVEVAVQRCDGVDPAVGALSASPIDLDATKTYYVRIVNNSGSIVVGGSDQLVTGATTATVHFPGITAPGSYTAQLLIDPGKQLAAIAPEPVTLEACLPTLAFTGPGVLLPLGSVAALLLTLGGAVVLGRLRRRMALSGSLVQ